MLALAGSTQEVSRIPSGTPLKWGMNGSVEIMPGNLKTYYGTNDTATAHLRGRTGYTTALGGNTNATRFAAVRAQCDNNAMVLQWTAVQQFGADNYEIEQSADGRNWRVVGVVPANRTELGEKPITALITTAKPAMAFTVLRLPPLVATAWCLP